MGRFNLKKDIKSYKSYIIHTLVPILIYGSLIGLIVGALIWGYNLAAEYISENTKEIYIFISQQN